MDQPGLDGNAHRRALAGLGRTNSICRVSQIIWRRIQRADVLPAGGAALRILDVAAGGGDVVSGIALLAARDRIAVEAHGCDISSTAIEYAQKIAARLGASGVEFFRLNALEDRLPEDYDVVMCTLFLHHLVEDHARELLRRMGAAARRLAAVDDLRRTRLGYLYAWAGARLLTRSHVVHVDGPLSVRAAFTMAEAKKLAGEAGWGEIDIRPHWPERFLMTWKKR
jgi:2-polyprenyl-3-methyl-5-hydroxy-6-metoxy-1,4-benzoquinol methylase